MADDPPMSLPQAIAQLNSWHTDASLDTPPPLAAVIVQGEDTEPVSSSDDDEDNPQLRRPVSEWLPFSLLRTSTHQRYDASRMVSSVLSGSLPTTQHGAFRLYQLRMREGRNYVRRQRRREHAATALRIAEEAAAAAVAAAIDAARAAAEEEAEARRCRVYCRDSYSCRSPWRSCPSTRHALSREACGLPHREASPCMQHPLTLHSACDICDDQRRLRLLFSLLPPDYEANSEDT